MKISEQLKKGMTFSFEVFPPKEDKPIEPLQNTLDKLATFRPNFISVTYGAGGTKKGKSEEVCKYILNKGIDVVSHFTCIGNSEEDVNSIVNSYVDIGIENMLCMRGDFPEGWQRTKGAYAHGDRLIRAVKESHPNLCLAGACYPEKHIDAKNFTEDIAHLRSKQDNGAEFLMAQLCYDVDAFEKFIEKKYKAGIKIPVIAGVMPVLYKPGLLRMTLSNGCSIPAPLADIIGKYGDNPEDFKKAGKEYTINLIFRYMSIGIDGLHLYSLNKYRDLAEIIAESGIKGNFDIDELQ